MGWIQDLVNPKTRRWEEFYRNRWQHDSAIRSTHGVNCTGGCSWMVYVKDGIVTWEMQALDYPMLEPNLLACEAPGVAGRVLNVATGVRVSLLDLLAILADLTGRRLEPVFEPARPGDVEHSFASIDAATRALGYTPTVDMVEGLRRTIEALRR